MARLSNLPAILKRLFAFNSVGAMGIVVQMSVLLGLLSHTKLSYMPATGLAVEAAILHNFIWHERWTWADRVQSGAGGLWRRLLYFHLANGLLSMGGNLVFMRIFVEKLGMNYMPANALAIALCSVLNFMAGDRLVFRKPSLSHKKEV